MKIRPITTTLLAASLLLALAACKGPEAEQAKQDAQQAADSAGAAARDAVDKAAAATREAADKTAAASEQAAADTQQALDKAADATANAADKAKDAATDAAAHASDATADAAQKVADKARDVANDAKANAAKEEAKHRCKDGQLHPSSQHSRKLKCNQDGGFGSSGSTHAPKHQDRGQVFYPLKAVNLGLACL